MEKSQKATTKIGSSSQSQQHYVQLQGSLEHSTRCRQHRRQILQNTATVTEQHHSSNVPVRLVQTGRQSRGTIQSQEQTLAANCTHLQKTIGSHQQHTSVHPTTVKSKLQKDSGKVAQKSGADQLILHHSASLSKHQSQNSLSHYSQSRTLQLEEVAQIILCRSRRRNANLQLLGHHPRTSKRRTPRGPHSLQHVQTGARRTKQKNCRIISTMSVLPIQNNLLPTHTKEAKEMVGSTGPTNIHHSIMDGVLQ